MANYIDASRFKQELKKSQGQNQVTEELGEMFIVLTNNIIKRAKWPAAWNNYPKHVKDEMISNALLDLMLAYNKYDLDRGTSVFAYFTTVVFNSFKRTLKNEKAHRTLITMMYQLSNETDPDSYRKYVDPDNTHLHKYLNFEEEKEDHHDHPEEEGHQEDSRRKGKAGSQAEAD